MPRRMGKGGTRVPRTALPYVVLGVALGLTAVGTVYVAMNMAARDRLRFQAAVHRVEGRMNARMATYTTMLRATDGFFAAIYPVLPDKFRAFTERLNLRQNYPGVFGIGYAVHIAPGGEYGFTAFMRNAVKFTDFNVWPASNEDDRTAIVYLEPLDERNKRAIGYDMYTEPVRREAMQRARDTGRAAASGRVILVQDKDEANPTAGFLMYMPVYAGGIVPAKVEARRANYKGFVYCPFRSNDFFGDVLSEEKGTGLEVRIYDGADRATASLLYGTADGRGDLSGEAMESVQGIEIGGRPWIVVMAAGPGFYAGPARYLPAATGIGGTLLSLGLFALVRGQVRARLRAERVTKELRKSREALRLSEGKFRRLTKSNLIAVVFGQLTGEVDDGNDAYFRMIGYTREQAGRGELRWDRITPPEYLSADERAVTQLRARGVCEPFEKEYVRPDGTRVPVMVGLAMLEGDGNETVGFAVDLTEIKRAQQALREAKESAETANRLKDEFLATVSHELRTPLNAILGWAQLLAAEGAADGDAAQGIETILRNARMQAQLIEDLLDISRIVSGKLRLEARLVDVAAVVRAAIGSVGLAAEAKGVQVVVEEGPAPTQVWGDPDRLQQVVWNLLSNAIKFTERGGAVQVRVWQDGAYAKVAVSDTGAGIDPAFMPYVFDRFRQADGSMTRKHGGLGLGLAIVKNLVEMHGGTVRADSAGQGQGATFTVSLPSRAGSPARAVGVAPARGGTPGGEARPASPSLAGVRALVVDDDADSRELVRHILAGHGAEVTTTATAPRTLDVMRAHPVDVLVSDLAMPDEDGYDLIRAVRELPPQYGGTVPAVALSAMVRPEERERALAAGYQVHLPKPVDPVVLTAAVAKLRAGETRVARS